MLCTFTAFGSGSAGSSVAAMSRTCASPSGELREFANVLNAADADSIYLYLPRNLSSCHMCAEVEEQHLEHKMKLLASFLRRESLDSGDDDVLSMKPIPAGKKTPTFIFPNYIVLLSLCPQYSRLSWKRARKPARNLSIEKNILMLLVCPLCYAPTAGPSEVCSVSNTSISLLGARVGSAVRVLC